MPSRFERYRVVDGTTPLAARYFNPVFQDLDLRLASLEEVRISWDNAVSEVVKFGLARIDELITEPLREVSNLSMQAQTTSAQLEQLRQAAQTHTADLTALINTLRNQTEQQVDAFIASTTQDAANDLAAWKALRTAELDAWVESFEASIEAAQQELQGDMAALHMGIKRLRTTRSANTKMVQADSYKLVDIVGGSFTQTFDAAASLGNGWWCYLRNSGSGDITLAPAGAELIDGVSDYVLYPGECRLIQCDGTTLRTLIVTPFCLTRRSSFDFRKPPGYQAFKIDIRGATGGGGGGGSGARLPNAGNTAYGGGGGGSSSPGGRCWAEFPATLVSELTPFTVGAGGQGGAGATTPTNASQNGLVGTEGSSGGTTSVVIDICSISVPGSVGGKAGAPGTISAAGTGGVYGAAPTSIVSITTTNSGTALSRYGLQTHTNGTGATGSRGETSVAGDPAPAPGGAGGISPWPKSSAGAGGNGGDGGPGVKDATTPSVGQPGGDGVSGMVIIKGVL